MPFLSCTVCEFENDELTVICKKCGSFIQDKIPNLDLFSTLWLMMETPEKAFKRIVISEHKNYIFFLPLFFGIFFSFASLRVLHFGNHFDNLLFLLIFGLFLGITGGLPLAGLAGTLFHAVIRMFNGSASFRNNYAVYAWSLMPFVLISVFVLPVELASMGLVLFTDTPSAFEIKPVVAWLLFAIDLIACIWSTVLLGFGFSTANSMGLMKSMLLSFATTAMFFTGIISILMELFL